MKFFNKRLDLNESEFDCLKKYIDFEKIEKIANEYKEKCIEFTLLEKLNNPKEIEHSQKKLLLHLKQQNQELKLLKRKFKMQLIF